MIVALRLDVVVRSLIDSLAYTYCTYEQGDEILGERA